MQLFIKDVQGKVAILQYKHSLTINIKQNDLRYYFRNHFSTSSRQRIIRPDIFNFSSFKNPDRIFQEMDFLIYIFLLPTV